MKKVVLLAVLAFLLGGCAYDFLNHRKISRYEHRSREMYMAQKDQLRVLDTMPFHGGANVHIRPIAVNNKGVGIYGYYRASSHFGRVKFFEYKPNTVVLIRRTNEDSLRMEVERFLRENEFNERLIRRALKRVKSTYDILSTDSF